MRNMYTYIVMISLIYASASQEVVGVESSFETRKKSIENVQMTLHPQPKGSKVDKRYYANAAAQYSYTHNKLINQPALCSQHENVFLLFAIRATYKNFAMRYILREQLNEQHYVSSGKHVIVKHVFLFGTTETFASDQLIKEESRLTNDILQDDFPETPPNGALKELMAWKWALEFCPNTEYVMILDDDVFVDVHKVVSFLLQDFSTAQLDDRIALCYAVGAGKNFHRPIKTFAHFPQDKVYQGTFYPQHCHRFGYAIHIRVVSKLYKASMSNPPLLPTRIWVAILIEKLRMKIPDNKSRYAIFNVQAAFADPAYPVKEVMIGHSEDKAFADKQQEVFRDVWASVKQCIIKQLRLAKIVTEPVENGYRLTRHYAVMICVPSIVLVILFYRYLKRTR